MPTNRRKRDPGGQRMNLFKSAVGPGGEPIRRRRGEAAEAAWSRLPRLDLDPARLRRNRIVTLDKAEPAHVPFDMLRTQILQTMRAQGWRSLAITSPTPGCGKTLTCLNLAFSLARQRKARIALVELDLRRPTMAELLDARPTRPVTDMLTGEASIEETMLRAGDGLALALADGPSSDSAELLHDDATADALAAMTDALDPDLVIYDLPPMLATDDAAAFLGHVDCAILIAAANESELKDIETCEARMAPLTEVMGIVLNKCEFAARDQYRYGYGYGGS